jgi:hypothetical protein
MSAEDRSAEQTLTGPNCGNEPAGLVLAGGLPYLAWTLPSRQLLVVASLQSLQAMHAMPSGWGGREGPVWQSCRAEASKGIHCWLHRFSRCMHCTAMHGGLAGCNDATLQRGQGVAEVKQRGKHAAGCWRDGAKRARRCHPPSRTSVAKSGSGTLRGIGWCLLVVHGHTLARLASWQTRHGTIRTPPPARSGGHRGQGGRAASRKHPCQRVRYRQERR